MDNEERQNKKVMESYWRNMNRLWIPHNEAVAYHNALVEARKAWGSKPDVKEVWDAMAKKLSKGMDFISVDKHTLVLPIIKEDFAMIDDCIARMEACGTIRELKEASRYDHPVVPTARKKYAIARARIWDKLSKNSRSPHLSISLGALIK